MRSILKHVLFSLTLAVSQAAEAAIPEPIGGRPGPGQSPGTGATTDTGVPNPIGRPGEAHHPDPSVGNRPPLPWFQNSFYPELIALEYAAANFTNWAHRANQYWLNYYGYWLYSATSSYRPSVYSSPSTPIFYPSWGHYPTRGDLIYFEYYWVRPLYFQILREGITYYGGAHSDPYLNEYFSYLGELRRAYHRFIRCIYGRNGDDAEALEDTEALPFESQAGLN